MPRKSVQLPVVASQFRDRKVRAGPRPSTPSPARCSSRRSPPCVADRACWRAHRSRRSSSIVIDVALICDPVVPARLAVRPLHRPARRRDLGRVRAQPAPARSSTNPQCLPEPPVQLGVPRQSVASTAAGRSWIDQPNVYRQKFDAYYGRDGRRHVDGNSRVSTGTFFPVVLATVVVAIGWTAVLWGEHVPDRGADRRPRECSAYGFLGAYVFNLQMLARRFFQSDLKPSAYASVVAAVRRRCRDRPRRAPACRCSTGRRENEAVVAFVVGLVPARRAPGAQPGHGRWSCGTSVPSLEAGLPAEPARRAQRLVRGPPARGGHRGHAEPRQRQPRRRHPAQPGARRPAGRLAATRRSCSSTSRRCRPVAGRRRLARGRRGPSCARSGCTTRRTFLKAFDVDEHGRPKSRAAQPAMTRLAARSRELPVEALVTIARLLHESPALRPIKASRDGEGASHEAVSAGLSLVPSAAVDERDDRLMAGPDRSTVRDDAAPRQQRHVRRRRSPRPGVVLGRGLRRRGPGAERVRRLRQPRRRPEPDVHRRARAQDGQEPRPPRPPRRRHRRGRRRGRAPDRRRRHPRRPAPRVRDVLAHARRTPRATSCASARPTPAPNRPGESAIWRSALVGRGGELLGAVVEDARVDG